MYGTQPDYFADKWDALWNYDRLYPGSWANTMAGSFDKAFINLAATRAAAERDMPTYGLRTVEIQETYSNSNWLVDRQKEAWGESDKNENKGIGQPGTLESFIPIWGEGRAGIDDIQNGNYWSGAFHLTMAVSDVFLVKSIGTALGKGAWKLGAHSWSATRKWMLKKGYAESGQPLHHWAIGQATAKKYGLQGIANQPWNLVKFETQALHMRAGHGMSYLGEQGFKLPGRLWYGTPTWFKAGIVSYGGRSAYGLSN